jgi:hypothetical protein
MNFDQPLVGRSVVTDFLVVMIVAGAQSERAFCFFWAATKEGSWFLELQEQGN